MAAKIRAVIPQAVRFNIFRRDNFTCRYCGRSSPAVVLHVEHVKPVAAGGTNDERNLVTACADCNHGKAARVGVTPPAVPEAPPPAVAGTGFVGLFVHSLDADGYIACQFVVERQVGPGRWFLVYFSWLDGNPGNGTVVAEADLLDEKRYRLYPDAETMDWVYQHGNITRPLRSLREEA